MSSPVSGDETIRINKQIMAWEFFKDCMWSRGICSGWLVTSGKRVAEFFAFRVDGV